MQARTRRDAPKLVPALLDQWERLLFTVDKLPDEEFAAPSRLPGWTVADLVVHTAGSAGLLARVVSGSDATATEMTAAGYLGAAWAKAVAGMSPAELIAEQARAEAAGLDAEGVRVLLRRDVEAAASALRLAVESVAAVGAAANGAAANGAAVEGAAVAGAAWAGQVAGHVPGRAGSDEEFIDVGRLVVTPAGGMKLGDFLVTRVVEAVVHGLDIEADPGRDALRITVRVLVDVLVATAPGHAVELRVPPYAAVQLVDGPRHTRGTPPNVVEADPVAFVEVAAGRLTWAEAVADGRVRASGERADISRLFPVL